MHNQETPKKKKKLNEEDTVRVPDTEGRINISNDEEE